MIGSDFGSKELREGQDLLGFDVYTYSEEQDDSSTSSLGSIREEGEINKRRF